MNLVKLLVAFFCLFLAGTAASQTNTPRTVSVNGNCGGYMEYLPADYPTATSKKYPTIIYIHGGASFGNGSTASLLAMANVEGVPLYIAKGQFPTSIVTPYGDTASFIAISPQFMRMPSTPQDVKGVIDYVLAHYRVDLNRLYLTGYSLGGNAVWQAPFNLAQAQRLAAIVPVAGYNNPYYDTTAQFIAGANVAVMAIHSTADMQALIAWSVNMVAKINSYNPATPAILARLTTQSHDSTVTAAYNPSYRPFGKNIYEWMLQYARFYPPIANAGKDTSITLPVNSVTLSGSGSADRQGTALTYLWTKTAGPAQYSISNAATANPVISGLIAGNYSFTLTVTNTAGLSSSATVKIYVINPNAAVPPVAIAGTDTSIQFPQTSFFLNGSNSYAPNGAIQTYSWTQLSGPTQGVLANPAAAATTVSNLRPGLYQFMLTIKDNVDSVGKATIRVRLINPFRDVAPTARAGGSQTITLPVNSVTLNGSASSDTDGVIISYRWRQLNGPSQSTISTPNQVSTGVTNLSMGIYQFELAVTDDSSSVGRDTLSIFVNPQPKLIQVNVYGGTTPAGTGWNNWNVSGNLTATALKYSDGTTSTVKTVLSASTAVADNGAGYPVTMCPQEVGRTASYFYNAPRTLVISGLNNSSQYNFEAYATRANTFTTNTYAIGGTTLSIQISNNYTNKASFSNLTPSNGAITVTINGTGSYNYLNGFTLTEIAKAVLTDKPPIANAGTDQSINLPTRQVTVDGSASYDPDGSIVSYNWQQVAGPTSATITTPNATTTTITGLDTGAYVFQLTVTDNQGSVATGIVNITVGTKGYNDIPPVANAGPDTTIYLPLDSIQLNASASYDPDGTISQYSWLKVAGPAQYKISNASIINPTISGLFAGTYQFELTVTDNAGISTKDTVFITVTATTPIPPVAEAGPDITLSIPTDSTTLNGSGSFDKTSSPLTYSWRKVSGPGQYAFNDSTLVSPLVRHLTGGVYIFELTVTDSSGLTGLDSVTVTVKPHLPPIAAAGPGHSISLVLPASSVQLDGSGSSDPDGTIVSYRWSEVSGPVVFSISDSTAIKPTISNLAKGVYVVALKVTDNLGATGSDTLTITVYPPLNIPPVANAGPHQTIILPASSAVLNGSASKDADGIIISYHWRQLSGPSTSVLSTPDSVITNVGGLVAGIYSFELAVTDDSLAVARDTTLVTVSTATRLVKVNIYGGSFPAGAGWNNWNVSSKLSSGALFYSDSSSSAISAVLSGSNGVADNGAGYPTTMCPTEVGRTTSYFWNPRTLTISGLDSTKKYNFELYSSRTSAYQNTFTIGSTSIVLNPASNYSNKAAWNNISPTGGQIVVSLFGSYNYLNGFTLTENAPTGSSSNASMMTASAAGLSSSPDPSAALTVFPNPFRDQLQLQIDKEDAGQVWVTLLDRSGRVLKQYAFTKAQGATIKTLPAPGLLNGIYYLKVQTATWIKTIMIVKQHN